MTRSDTDFGSRSLRLRCLIAVVRVIAILIVKYWGEVPQPMLKYNLQVVLLRSL